LEYVLYRDGGLLAEKAGPTDERRASWDVECGYALAVGRNLAERGRELAQAWRALAGMQTPIAHILTDPDAHQKLKLVVLLLGNAKRLLDENLAPVLGVTIGFNALDGD